MAYSVGPSPSPKLKIQLVRITRSPYLLVQYLSAFSKTCGYHSFTFPNHVPCTFLFFPLYFHFITKHPSAHFLTALHHPVIPTNAHISGFRAPRQRRPTNCSILPNPSGCTSTKARSCAYEWRETNSAMMSRARRKRPRVSTSADQLGVYHTRSP